MGQRTSLPQSEVAPRPRTNSDLANGSAAAVGRHHSHRNGVSSNTSGRSRFQLRDSSSTSSSSNNVSSAEEDNHSEQDAVLNGVQAALLINQLGLSTDSLHSATPGSLPTSTGMHNQQQRTRGHRSEGASGGGNFSLFHSRSSHRPHRYNGSQRLRSSHGSSSTSNAAELLAHRGRLSALLRNLDAAVAASTSSDSSNAHSGTQQQQVILNRLRHSLPLLQLLGRDIKCPMCHKQVPSEDVEVHLVMCLTRPVLSYNDDILTVNKGECAICLEEMDVGNQIARLPCLCIYHKGCIDEWFKRKNTCPEHPPVEDD